MLYMTFWKKIASDSLATYGTLNNFNFIVTMNIGISYWVPLHQVCCTNVTRRCGICLTISFCNDVIFLMLSPSSDAFEMKICKERKTHLPFIIGRSPVLVRVIVKTTHARTEWWLLKVSKIVRREWVFYKSFNSNKINSPLGSQLCKRQIRPRPISLANFVESLPYTSVIVICILWTLFGTLLQRCILSSGWRKLDELCLQSAIRWTRSVSDWVHQCAQF